MASRVSSISASRLISLARDRRLAIIDVRDEERSYDAHIGGSLHFSSETFSEKLPDLAQSIQDKDIVVFHCALSQVRGPSCARVFSDYLLDKNEEESKKRTIVVLEKGFNGWHSSRNPVCSCSDIPCKKDICA